MLHKISSDAKMYLSVNMYCLIKVVIQESELVPCCIPATGVTLYPSTPSALCLYITEELDAGQSKQYVQSQMKAGILT